MVPVIHVFSLLVFSKLFAFLCIIFRRGVLLGRQPCRPIWCSVRRMVWALTGWPPTPSTSAALICLFLKHNLLIWRWAHALNFFFGFRVRALNLTVPLGSGRVGSDDLGYGPGSGFSFEPVQNSTIHYLMLLSFYCPRSMQTLRWTFS